MRRPTPAIVVPDRERDEDPVLRAVELEKTFGSNRAVKAVSLDFRRGEILGLVGENGAGKSTLVAMLSGATAPDSGTILMESAVHSSLSPNSARRYGIDAIHQDPALVPTMSVFENLLLGREPRTKGFYSRTAARRLAAEWLATIGARIALDATIDSLSPAQRQQVEIAKAIGSGARVAFFDEPTAALGPKETDQLFDLIRRLAASGTSIVYISHRLEEIFAICQRVVVMREGELVADRPVGVFDEQALVELMVGHRVAATPRSKSVSADPGEGLILKGIGHQKRIRDINVQFHTGEVHGVFGIVGSGRSRLASVLTGLERADSGEMQLDGVRYAPKSPRDALHAGVVLVPEDRRSSGLFGELSVASNVVIGQIQKIARFGFVDSRVERREAQAYTEQLDIRPTDPSLPGSSLSGGNQQKVLLARALFSGARFVVLDEPTQGIDIGAKEDIHMLIRQLANSGSAVVVISSDLRELLGVSDRITVLARGEVAATFEGDMDNHTLVAAAVGGSVA